MRKTLAAVAIAAGVVGLTACGPVRTVANNNYCVNEITGQVMPPPYCQVGSMYYNPHMYDYWVGATYGHSYGVGTVIQHNYFVSGRQVSPSNTNGRLAAGLPVTGSVSNGSTNKVTTSPAKPQNSPSRVGVSGSAKTGTSTTKSSTSFGSRSYSGSTTRSSTSFGTSSRSSFGSGSSSFSRSSSSFGSRSRP